LDGSVVSHFISLPGVTMSNWAPARLVTVELFTMFPVTSVPKYLPCASAAARSVDAAEADPATVRAIRGAAASAVAATTARSRLECARVKNVPGAMCDLHVVVRQ